MTLKQFGKTALFTAVEAGTLAAWLALTGFSAYLAVVVLLVGLLLEHVLSYNFRNGRKALDWSQFPGGEILLIAAVETVIWAGWLALVPKTAVGAFVVLFAGLILGHGVELNVVRGFSPLTAYRDRLKRSLDITGIEAVIGTAWLTVAQGGQPIVAVGLLFVGLLVEHLVSGRKRLA